MRDKIIFLDIDGVLLSLEYMHELHGLGKKNFKVLDPNCVRRFNQLIFDTKAKVVISSTWRIGHTVEEMQDQLRVRGVKAKVIGVTPNIHPSVFGNFTTTPRGREIQTWMDLRVHEKFDFAILDDDTDMEHLSSRLVKTDGYIGLQDNDCELVKLLLK